MFRSLTNDRCDIIGGLYVPELTSPPPQARPMLSPYNKDQTFHPVERVIVSGTSVMYNNFIDWTSIYLMTFPERYGPFPAMITRDGKILVNSTTSNTIYDLNKHTFSVSEPSDLAASVLYGINLKILRNLTDEDALTKMFSAVVTFLYALIRREFIRDTGVMQLPNDDIARLYYSVARLVLSCYFVLEGANANGVAQRITHDFFTGDFRSRVTYNPGNLPESGIPLYSYTDVLKYLDEMNIIPSASIQEFRRRLVQDLSMTPTYCLSNGITLVAMLLSCNVPSNVFSEKINMVSPKSITQLQSALSSHLVKTAIKARKEKDEHETIIRSAYGFDF